MTLFKQMYINKMGQCVTVNVGNVNTPNDLTSESGGTNVNVGNNQEEEEEDEDGCDSACKAIGCLFCV